MRSGWTCDLVPKALIVARYFAAEQEAINKLEAELESITAQLTEMEEEHGGDEGAFSELEKVNKANVIARLKEIQSDQDAKQEAEVLTAWLKLSNRATDLNRVIKDADADLDAKAHAKYPKLTEVEIQTLVVDDKWLAALDAAIHGEMDRISQALTERMKELAERYETPMPEHDRKVADRQQAVTRHLKGVMQELCTGKIRLPGFTEEWQVAELGDLGTWKGGMTPSMKNPTFWDKGTVPWISSGDVKSVLLTETASMITEAAVKQGKTTLLPPKCIVVVTRTRSGILRRFLPVAMNTVAMAINQDIKALIPGDHHDPFYLLQLLIGYGEREL